MPQQCNVANEKKEEINPTFNLAFLAYIILTHEHFACFHRDTDGETGRKIESKQTNRKEGMSGA